jgi:hypothetical protein
MDLNGPRFDPVTYSNELAVPILEFTVFSQF